MNNNLENMSLCEYRNNAYTVLQDYRPFIPVQVYESALWVLLQWESTESDITRALKSCRDAL